MKLTRNFSLSEFNCRDGTAVPTKYTSNVLKLANALQMLRDLLGEPITIISGYRTEAHNAKVGGARHSQHLTASAADIKVSSWSPAQVARLYQGLITLGTVPDGGLGLYDTFVHIDLGKPRRWDLRENK